MYIYIYQYSSFIRRLYVYSPFTNHLLATPGTSKLLFFSPDKKTNAPKQKATIWYPAWDGVAVNMATDVKKEHEVGMPRNRSLGW